MATSTGSIRLVIRDEHRAHPEVVVHLDHVEAAVERLCAFEVEADGQATGLLCLNYVLS